MTLKKTCWYTTLFPLRAGALIGSRGTARPDSLLAFGFLLGAAFQITDDVLNLVGDESAYGKELDGDLLEGKRTLMLIFLLESASAEERAHIERVLEAPRQKRRESDVAWLRERFDHYRCIERATEFSRCLSEAAVREFDSAFEALPDSTDKRFLRDLPRWVLTRD